MFTITTIKIYRENRGLGNSISIVRVLAYICTYNIYLQASCSTYFKQVVLIFVIFFSQASNLLYVGELCSATEVKDQKYNLVLLYVLYVIQQIKNSYRSLIVCHPMFLIMFILYLSEFWITMWAARFCSFCKWFKCFLKVDPQTLRQ